MIHRLPAGVVVFGLVAAIVWLVVFAFVLSLCRSAARKVDGTHHEPADVIPIGNKHRI